MVTFMTVTLCARHLPNNLITSSVTQNGRKCKYTGQSVRAIPMRVITVGKKRSRGVQLIVDEYKDKLQPYCTIDDVLIRSNPKNARDVKAQIEEEDFAVVNLIKSNDWVVILDERGLDVGSERLAEVIGDAGLTGASRMIFCIGGPYGHGRQLQQRANLSLKLSSLVLNHQIALVVLMEQLYSMDYPQRSEVSSLENCLINLDCTAVFPAIYNRETNGLSLRLNNCLQISDLGHDSENKEQHSFREIQQREEMTILS